MPRVKSGPGSFWYKRDDIHGVKVWTMEVCLGSKPDGSPDRRRRDFHGSETACARALTLFYAEEYRNKEQQRVRASKLTVAQWAEQYLSMLEANNRAATTLRSYRELLYNRILPGLGSHQLKALTPRHIQLWLSQMLDQRHLSRVVPADSPQVNGKKELPLLSNTSINTHYRVLRAMLNAAVKLQLIPSNPALAVDPPAKDNPGTVAYDNAELSPILDALNGYDTMFRVLIHLALTGGARRGELIGLQWSNVNYDAACIEITASATYATGKGQYDKDPKTARGKRVIPLTPDMVDLLKTWQQEQSAQRAKSSDWKGAEYICTTKHGTRIQLDYANRKLARFLTRNNLPKIGLHGLRHTYATRLIAGGIPVADVSALIGHAQNTTTYNIYVHPATANRAQAATVIAATLPPKSPPTPQNTPEIEHK